MSITREHDDWFGITAPANLQADLDRVEDEIRRACENIGRWNRWRSFAKVPTPLMVKAMRSMWFKELNRWRKERNRLHRQIGLAPVSFIIASENV